MDQRPVMVIGATGYVGGRLTPRLLANGWRVRAVGRSMAKLRSRPWAGHPNLELAQADVMDPGSLLAAAKGCQAGFYLVNSLDSTQRDFAADHQAAVNLAAAAAQGGLGRVIYLGGAGPFAGAHQPPTGPWGPGGAHPAIRAGASHGFARGHDPGLGQRQL